MRRPSHRRQRERLARAALVLLAVVACLPNLAGVRDLQAQSVAGSLRALLQPNTQDLEAAFSLVSQGALPRGYPTPPDGWLVPASLLKAVAWTESTWRQFDAPRHTLVSADGGYGLMQITSGMWDGTLPAVTRSAIADNFLYNIAYGAQVLVQKWLHTPNIGNDDPAFLEHWYYALWAYNGWGWVNNPNNPAFSRAGTPATDPESWPYQERVFYWLSHPPRVNGVPLWPSIPVTMPSAQDIGQVPGPLPETAAPHADVLVPAPHLNLGAGQDVAFLSDLSVPDGLVVQPGQTFHKVWLLENRGFSAWPVGARWAPVGGTPMGNPVGVAVPQVPPLATVAVGADLLAPLTPGAYKEFWQMTGPDGRRFGVRAWVAIRVAGAKAAQAPASSATPDGLSDAAMNGSAPTPASAGLVARPAAAAAASTATINGDGAVYAGDMSVPDGTVLRPGQRFVKSWRIRNIGTTTWTAAYHWHFEAGTQMSNVLEIPVPPTAPGGTAILSVSMLAPTATGVYTSFWQMTNAAGRLFPNQAWVNIVVRGGAAAVTSGPTPRATVAPTAVPTPPSQPTLPAPGQTQPPPPTVVIPGGGGQFVASPWIGALNYRIFFPAGSTLGANSETLGLYNPGASPAHVRVTFYRPDGAQRQLQFTLTPAGRRILTLRQVAPGTNLAAVVEADRAVIAERAMRNAAGLLADPGAARTARSWDFPPIPDGAPPSQWLVFFNPHDLPATVTVRAGRLGGGCCAAVATLTIPPRQQFQYQLGTAPALRGPLTLFAGDVVAAERLVASADGATTVAIPGTVAGARDWYIPYLHSDRLGGALTIFNPGNAPATATIRLALDEGAGGFIQRAIPPFSAVQVPLSALTSAVSSAAEVSANAPVVVNAVRYWGRGVPAVAIGSAATARGWTLLSGLAGAAQEETLDIMNPASSATQVTIHLTGARGAAVSWSITLPAHSRYARILNNLEPPGGGVVQVLAAQPVTVGHSVSGSAGAASSPGFPLPSP